MSLSAWVSSLMIMITTHPMPCCMSCRTLQHTCPAPAATWLGMEGLWQSYGAAHVDWSPCRVAGCRIFTYHVQIKVSMHACPCYRASSAGLLADMQSSKDVTQAAYS